MLISDFARLGQVSVRMLRHYDAIGLLVPDRIEDATGYRSYSPDQLHILVFGKHSSKQNHTRSTRACPRSRPD